MRAETLKGHLDGILLAVLEPEPRHGYAIMEALRVRSGGQVDLPTGTVYPALHRLERAGLVQAAWSATGGRRRVYQLPRPAGARLTPSAAPGATSPRPSPLSCSPCRPRRVRHDQAGVRASTGGGRPPAVERYLAEVTARLPGPVRAQAGIVAELRSGLLDAVDAHRSAGQPPARAAAAAVSELGAPAEIAAAFRAEIAAGQARRVAVILLVTGPLVGLLWIAEAAASHLGLRFGLPWPWTAPSPGLHLGPLLIAVTVAVTAWGSMVGIATTGRLPARPRRAPTTAVVAGCGARRCLVLRASLA